jgi:7-cyano-7-deazaguanine reductase
MPSFPRRELETFPNPAPERDYTIRVRVPEFTCLCPKTGQPDFAELTLEYIPDEYCVELKALKLYVWSYRDQGAFHEAVTNQILAMCAEASIPPSWPNTAPRDGWRQSRFTCLKHPPVSGQ